MRHGVAFIQLFDLIVYRKPYDLLEVLRLYLSRGQCKRFLIIIPNTAVYDQMTLKDSVCQLHLFIGCGQTTPTLVNYVARIPLQNDK